MFVSYTSVFVPSSITCVNLMKVSYIPIAKAGGFTTHWIIFMKVLTQNKVLCI